MNSKEPATNLSPTGRQPTKSRLSGNDSKKISNDRDNQFISLTKLKNYIPKANKLTENLLSKLQKRQSTPNRAYSSIVSTTRGVGSYPFNDIRAQTQLWSSNSRLPNNIELNRNPQGTNFNSFFADHNHLRQTYAAASKAALYQVGSIVAPQEFGQPQKHSEAANSNVRSIGAQESLKEVESSRALDKYKAKRDATEREHCFQRIDCEERRKRNRIDSLHWSADSRGTQNKSDDTSKVIANGCGRNNMTPSSLLLIQNSNCIEKQQQHQSAEQQQQQQQQQHRREQQATTTDYNQYTVLESENSNASQAHRGNSGIEHIYRQVRESSKKSSDSRHHESTDTSGIRATAAEVALRTPATATLNCKLQSSSSSSSYPSLMLTDTNHFVISSPSLDSNSSINAGSTNDNNNKIANLSTSKSVINEPLIYSTPVDEDSRQHRSQNQHLINNQYFQQNYHQGPSVEDIRNNTAGRSQFVQYNASSNLLADQYYRSFQPFRLDQSTVSDELGDNSSNNLADPATRSNLNSSVDIAPGLDFAQQQTRPPIKNDSYSGHSQYDLMPTPSSKSSSPHSNHNLTPSPRTNSMQTVSSGHNNSGQIHPTGLNTVASTMSTVESSSHLDHLNQHYNNNNGNINTAAVANLTSHHQNQINQHHAYNQQATSVANQHHLNLASQEQVYAQQQQHSQHQHQQQQTNLNSQQHSIYHQIANGAVIGGGGINHSYGQSANGIQYPAHMQTSAGNHQPSNLMVDAHQNHLNTAAAACAAAAVVSQTLKTVANQHGQHHGQPYGGHIANGFNTTTGGLMNMTSQHHQQLHSNVGSMAQHHAPSQAVSLQHQYHHHHHQNHTHTQHQQLQTTQLQQSRTVNQTTSIVTRKYQCKMCPQVFMSKAEMKYHNQNHMREAKPYKCLQCPKAFANSSYLSQHMRIHQGVKPYTCDICARKFTQLSHLQQHRRTHSGDKPYKCQYPNCTKQFSQLSNLQSHSRCHQLDKPYKCNSCYKCFQDEQSLLEHIPRHLESKHLKKNLCIFCGSSYQQERGLVKHFQQYHTDKTPTLVAAAIGAGTTGNTSLVASLISSSQNGVFATPSSGSTSSSSSTTSSVSSNSAGSISGNTGTGMNNSGSLGGQNAPSGGYQLGGSVF